MADSDLTNGPVYIKSSDNPSLALTVLGAAAGPVTLERVGDGDWNTPLSQWVLTKVTDGVYQISLYASNGTLYLQAGGTTATSPINVAAQSVEPVQLWKMEAETDDQLLACVGAPGVEAGFAGDIPVPSVPLTLQPAADDHNTGDKFAVSLVFG